MNTKEYDQKKWECWAALKKQSECEGGCLMADAFFHAFDRAYALGKQEKDVEKPKKSKRMCLRDKSKVCNKCHECDIEQDAWYSMCRQ